MSELEQFIEGKGEIKEEVDEVEVYNVNLWQFLLHLLRFLTNS